jgi:hypothetical protein
MGSDRGGEIGRPPHTGHIARPQLCRFFLERSTASAEAKRKHADGEVNAGKYRNPYASATNRTRKRAELLPTYLSVAWLIVVVLMLNWSQMDRDETLRMICFALLPLACVLLLKFATRFVVRRF